MRRTIPTSKGPFRADQIRSGDPYELSNGHAIPCSPPGGRGSRANLLGGSVLGSDPAVEEAGIDTGYSPTSDTLRAPDVAVGNVPDTPGWVQGAPPLRGGTSLSQPSLSQPPSRPDGRERAPKPGTSKANYSLFSRREGGEAGRRGLG
jgi:hypothetical protein